LPIQLFLSNSDLFIVWIPSKAIAVR